MPLVFGRLPNGGFRKRSNPKPIAPYGHRFNIWQLNPNSKPGLEHPATFPEELARDHIRSWSNEGDLVFDPFMGSGTTGAAAIKLNRRFVGCEINKDYFSLSKDRIQDVVRPIKEDPAA